MCFISKILYTEKYYILVCVLVIRRTLNIYELFINFVDLNTRNLILNTTHRAYIRTRLLDHVYKSFKYKYFYPSMLTFQLYHSVGNRLFFSSISNHEVSLQVHQPSNA